MEESDGTLTTPINPKSLTSTLADSNEICQSQISSDASKCIDSVFGSIPTRAEADYSMTAFQRYELHLDLNFLLFVFCIKLYITSFSLESNILLYVIEIRIRNYI